MIKLLKNDLMVPGLKTPKKVKISKSLFRDFLICRNQIDYEESENRSPETQGSILWDHGPKISKKGMILGSLSCKVKSLSLWTTIFGFPVSSSVKCPWTFNVSKN